MTALAVFGCSWTVGTGVLPTDTFGARLSNKLSTTNFTNLGIEGSSNSRSVLQLLDYVKRTDISLENSIAVFLITTPARECVIADSSRQCRAHIIDLISGPTDKVTRSWIKNFASTLNANFNLHKNVLSMQAICRQYNIRDYYIAGWSDMNLNLPGVDTAKIYDYSCAQLFGFKDMTDYVDNYEKQALTQYVRICGHPNELGHELIARTLYNWITNPRNVQSKI
jgi:hypothetical protein